jgi:malate dehydrogenase (oxaloacetate-decarboxylating)
MPDIYQESLELHEQHHGKLETVSKVPLANRTDLARAYTPGVAAVCTAISNDKHLAYKYTIKANTVAVVTDGSAILGLGNLGPEAALPVMEGKAILFKQFGCVDAFPICLDTQNVEEIIKAVKLIAPVFGGVNLEDISAPRCFEIEERLVKELDIPVMHDDQHGTATVVLAALINALKVKGLEAQTARVVLSGAGAAGTSVTKMLLAYGFVDVSVCDSRGIMSRDRADLNPSKKALVEVTNPRSLSGGLADALKGADIFIGVSAPGVLKPEMIREMSPKPIVFALANPVPEIMPDEAKAAGAYVVATGRSDFPNQVNNVLVFPGVFRGALAHGVKRIEKSMLVQAAKNLAACVPNPDATHILPDPFDPEVAQQVADAIR